MRFIYKKDKKTRKYLNNTLINKKMSWRNKKGFKKRIKFLINYKLTIIRNKKQSIFKGSNIIFKDNKTGMKDKLL